MTDGPDYAHRAEWSAPHCQYRAICLEFPGLHAIALTPHEAIEHVQELVGEILAEYADGNMDPPSRSPTIDTAANSRSARHRNYASD